MLERLAFRRWEDILDSERDVAEDKDLQPHGGKAALLRSAAIRVTRDLRRAWTNGTSLKGRIFRAAYWSLVGAVCSRGLTFVASIILARTLNIEDFGAFSLVQSTLAFLAVFSTAGLGLTATKFVAQHRSIRPHEAQQFIHHTLILAAISGTLVACASFFFASTLARQVFGSSELADDLRIASPFLLFSAIAGVQTGVIVGLEQFRTLAAANTVRSGLQLLLMALGAYYWGVLGAIGGQVTAEFAGMVVTQVMLIVTMRRLSLNNVTAGFEWNKIKALMKFSIPAFLASVVLMPAMWLSNVLLVRQVDGYAALAVFNVADRFRQLILFLPASLSPVVLSMLSNLHDGDQRVDRSKVFSMNLKMTLVSVLVPSAVIVLLAHWSLALYGSAYESGSATLLILTLSASFVALNTVLGQPLVSTGRIWYRFAMDSVLAVLLVVFSLLLVPSMKDQGLALANLGAFGITVGGLYFLQHKSRAMPYA